MALLINRTSVPKPSWRVRRRRVGEQRWLVRFNDFYELDELSDAVWLACNDGLDIDAIVRRLVEERGIAGADAAAATIAALRRFAELGLVEFDD